MKSFNVRLEFNITTIGLLDVPVMAKTIEEARKLAILKFYNDELNEDIRLSEEFEASFRKSCTKDFIVEEASKSGMTPKELVDVFYKTSKEG